MFVRFLFDFEVNSSISVGDVVYGAGQDYGAGNNTLIAGGMAALNIPMVIGHVHSWTSNSIIVNANIGISGTYTIEELIAKYTGSYIFIKKPDNINKSSLRGYYAEATFNNNSGTYAELFAISSEASPSSK